MPTIKFENVQKIYPNNVQAVFDFNLNVRDKEFVVLVGPSGCGKSTTLRMLAGLESITDGKIFIDGECINDVEAKDRNIAMVFQNYALYPHMTVEDNMAFSLKLRKKMVPVYEEDGSPKMIIDEPLIKRLRTEIKLLKKSWYLDPQIVELNEQIRNLQIYASKKIVRKGKEIMVVDKEQITKLAKRIHALQKQFRITPSQTCLDEIASREKQIEYLSTTPTAPAYVEESNSKDEIAQKIAVAAEKLGLTEYLKRKPAALSGGQRQRVALGRAIVRNPKVFLMDEPLSNLDAKLRVQMRSELIKIHRESQTTTIYVTHDQTEAMTMADRIVIMKDGYIQQIGTPEEIYNIPANTFVGGFIGNPAMNFLTGKLANNHFVIEQDGAIVFDIDVSERTSLADYNGNEIILGIRPEDIELCTKSTKKAHFDMACDISELLGYERLIYGYIGNQKIITKTKVENTVQSGCLYKFSINMNKVHFFDVKTTARIK